MLQTSTVNGMFTSPNKHALYTSLELLCAALHNSPLPCQALFPDAMLKG
jgi:hypothetical protein